MFPGAQVGTSLSPVEETASGSSYHLRLSEGFPDGSAVENLPAKQEMQIQSLGWEDPLEEGTATHSGILA